MFNGECVVLLANMFCRTIIFIIFTQMLIAQVILRLVDSINSLSFFISCYSKCSNLIMSGMYGNKCVAKIRDSKIRNYEQ